MATWGIGDKNDSDEVYALKEQILAKDAQLATLHSQLMKKDEDTTDIRLQLNEVTAKLRREADRAVELDACLIQRNELLQNERVTCHNTEVALESARQKLQVSEQTIQELHSTLDAFSSQAQSSSADKSRIERDNQTLQKQIRSLQLELAAKESTEQTLLRQSQTSGGRGRRRSSSVSTFRVTALEREVTDSQARSARQAAELREVKEHLSCAQNALVQLENEKTAMERQLRAQLEQTQAELEEQKADLMMMEDNGGLAVVAREECLLERLNDEEKRVVELESELARLTGSHKRELTLLQGEMERTCNVLEEEKRRVAEAEGRLLEIIGEKEEALDQRDHIHKATRELQRQLQTATDKIRDLEVAHMDASDMATCHDSIPRSPDPETAATVQRLLSAIERLRGERDQLRRDLDFVKAENKFALEDMKTRLAAAVTLPPTPPEVVAHHGQAIMNELASTSIHRNSRIATVFALVAQHIEGERERCTVQADELVIALSLARHEAQEAIQTLGQKDACIQELYARLGGKEEELRGLQAVVENATHNLQEAESRITGLTHIVGHLQEEVSRERSAHANIGATLAEVEAQLTDVTQELAEAEEQRDALALQVRHTQQDLDAARQELAEADLRHGQQLCAMSSGEPTRALREEIDALKERVLRRTEQIGLHQHDIKRLEINLRLQEERLAEMTADMEVLQGEKAAMVEDCQATREERDEARTKCEALDERVERLEEERDAVKMTLSSTVEQQRSMAEEVNALSNQLAQAEAQYGILVSKLSASEEHGSGIEGELIILRQQHAAVVEVLDRTSSDLQSALLERDSAGTELIQSTLALAVAYTGLRSTIASLQQQTDAASVVQAQTTKLQTEVESKHTLILIQQQELDHLRAQFEEIRTTHMVDFADVKSSLEEELRGSQTAYAELQSLRQQDLGRLAQITDELQAGLHENASLTSTTSELRKELSLLQTKHTSEVMELQARLQETKAQLDHAERLRDEVSASQKRAEEALTTAKHEMETRLEETLEKLDASERTNDELISLRQVRENEMNNVREQLDRTSEELAKLANDHDSVKTKYQHASEALEALQAEASKQSQDQQDVQKQLDDLRAEHANELAGLQDRLDLMNTDLRETQDARSEMEIQYTRLAEELGAAKEELEHQLSSSQEEVEYLKATLRGEMELRNHDRTQYELDMELAKQKRVEVEQSKEKLAEALAELRTQLKDVNTTLGTLQDEKTEFQFAITNLEAEVQRSKSLHRFLESQVKDSELQVATLQAALDKARADLISTEKACEAAEATLSMREIQHEQTLAALRREINVLRGNLKLEDKIVELEERNLEMEELLKSKCLEIEENDDRYIEMLKEKKKLSSKVESLTRKIHTLQAKLALMSDPNTLAGQEHVPATVTQEPTPRTSPVDFPPTTLKSTAHAVPPVPRLPGKTSATPISHSRAVSGPSTLPTPKTPEIKAAQQAVFRPRTPELKRIPSQAPVSFPTAGSSSTPKSKKRRAPDDFEDCESLPPQGFTAESVPSTEGATPCVRKAMHSIRSGFTPVRNHVAHPHSTQVSPSRRATTGASLPPVIADVTNSPRSKHSTDGKTTRKGWLGKIRGAPAPAPSSRAASSRQTGLERIER